MCDIWRAPEPQQLSPEDLERHLNSFRNLGVRWVVFSGGEPQLNKRFALMAATMRDEGIRVTLLTAGLLLESQAEAVAQSVDDIIVSLDGPAVVHNKIRRVADAYERMLTGIKRIRTFRPDIRISGRCTVQKENHRFLIATVETARSAELNSISFLPADVTSEAFNRSQAWSKERQEKVTLCAEEVNDLEVEIERLICNHSEDIAAKFVAESAVKLRRIVLHFRVQLGMAEAVAPRCNAPWVSAVIEASGDVKPCFFHPSLGNIHGQSLDQIVNSPNAIAFRGTLEVETNPICRRCVCSLYVAPHQ
jgi:MoaA/NifB/PqqE/SkfB family radical SAM enzyme